LKLKYGLSDKKTPAFRELLEAVKANNKVDQRVKLWQHSALKTLTSVQHQITFTDSMIFDLQSEQDRLALRFKKRITKVTSIADKFS